MLRLNSTLEEKDLALTLTWYRFVGVPMSTVDKRLVAEKAELKSDVSGLEKKLSSLEMTHKNSMEHYERFVKSGGKA
ncbi:unnamed protein product [Aspergillus oryzae]|uniref:Unnamed protein product n=1 Tax=Aspergillus oryzae TaxID=5062 RepID=A0AAN4YPC2_ASPOZ|nr:unnamed protein product [Aspergillus oryzae]